MQDNRLRCLVFREWENNAPKIGGKVYQVECLVDQISSFCKEAYSNGYELEAVLKEGEY